MTGKQMIIDYENLCENYSKEVGCYNTFDGSCIKEQCFTYRLLQLLKAKEQECEALQMSENEAGEIIAELEAYKDINEDFKTAWEELKAENEEFKKIINEAKSSSLDLKSFLVGEAIQEEYEQQLDQLKQTLTKIKKICENNDELQGNFNVVDCDKYKLGKHNLANKILQKISECEVENDT